MIGWQGILIGLATGIIATLIADNPHFRFHLEKAFRKLTKKTLISATLSSFTNYCSDGMFLIYCIELKNKMWFTPQIPRVYLLSEGAIDYDSHAYKPFIYFRSRGISIDKLKYTNKQLLEEYSSRIIPYTPDNPNLSLSLSRKMPYRVVVLCELIETDDSKQSQPLNALKVVGELYAAVANPMPKTAPNAWWNMRVISEDFGLIDVFKIKIPKDLEEKEPLGDSIDALKMSDRPPCLLDLGDENNLTWPLRFTVNDCEIIVKCSHPREIEVRKPKKRTRIGLRGISGKHRTSIDRGIKIQ
jgi:hypothetical protein